MRDLEMVKICLSSLFATAIKANLGDFPLATDRLNNPAH